MTLRIQTDRTLIRAQAESTRYILARVDAPRAPRRGERLPVNVAIVLDRSGSMADERKFGLAREAVEQSLRMLRPEDRFSLVVYDSVIDVLAPSTLATPDAVRRALDSLGRVGPRGSTNLGGGWLKGCEQVAEFLDDDRVSRCLLLSDGLANQGITDRGELARHARELRQRGVATSTFGVGADFDERLMRDMAHEGGGNFYFIEGASQIPDILTSELGEALEVTLRDATLVVRPRGRERVETLGRFRTRGTNGREVHVELGDLASGQQLDVVLSVRFPQGDMGSEAGVDFELQSSGERMEGAAGEQRWTYASHAENDRQPRNSDVDRAVAALYAARARAEATEANREGNFEEARRVLEGTARRIRSYAGNDRELRELARSLQQAVPEYAEAPMDAMRLKVSFAVAESAMRGRDRLGRARRER
jgi:Ca-activated chloride channel family protein